MERNEKIRKTVEKEYEKGTALPAVRKILAAKLGGDPSLYLGTADPIFYRLAGLASPLEIAPAKTEKGLASNLAKAIRKRRDAGVRWETVAASAEAAIGRRVSTPEAKRLYAKAGGDLAASYAGRGTRVGAPATYADLAVAPEEAAKTNA